MQKKAFSLALLLSLSLPVMQLDAMLDDVKDLAGLLARYVIKTGTIAGAVGGTWFMLKQIQDRMSQRKGYGSGRGHGSGRGTSGSEQSRETLRALLDGYKGELQTQLNNLSQTIEANKEESLEGLKAYKTELDALKITLAQQESTILGKTKSQLDNGIKNHQATVIDGIIKRLEARLDAMQNYKTAIDKLAGRLDDVENDQQGITANAQLIKDVNTRLGQVETQRDAFNTRLATLEAAPKETK